MKVCVVGAGAWGAATALFLARLGASVMLLEATGHSAGATGFAAGILTTQTWYEKDSTLVSRTLKHIRDIETSVPHSVFRRTGMIRIVPAQDKERLSRLVERQRRAGEDAKMIGATDARRFAPEIKLREEEEVASYSPQDGYVSPTDLVGAELSLARSLRVRYDRRRVTSITEISSGVKLEASGAELKFDAVVVTAGVWTRKLVRDYLDLPVIPYKTQLGLVTYEVGLGPVVDDQALHFYFRPESSKSIAVGDGTSLGNFDPDNFDTRGETGFQTEVSQKLLSRLGKVESSEFITSWAGLVGGTPDRHPLLGPINDAGNVIVGCGDNGFGVMRSLAIGEYLAHVACGRQPPVDLSEFSARRFGARPPKFEPREGFTIY